MRQLERDREARLETSVAEMKNSGRSRRTQQMGFCEAPQPSNATTNKNGRYKCVNQSVHDNNKTRTNRIGHQVANISYRVMGNAFTDGREIKIMILLGKDYECDHSTFGEKSTVHAAWKDVHRRIY